MIYAITHTTHYRYFGEVALSYHLSRLQPRTLDGQRCDTFELRIDPPPAELAVRQDSFGNAVHYFEIHQAHTLLEVAATSRVSLHPPEDPAGAPWEQVRDALAVPVDEELMAARMFCLPSPLVPLAPALADYARVAFTPGRDIVEAAMAFCAQVHGDFEFIPGVTEVGTPVQEVFHARRGVCQDFAHLTVSCLRSIGLAARYVSGYLETDPPPGGAKLMGADASHAWVSLRTGRHQWMGLDPTNNLRPAARHVVIGWGRDFADISPLQGVLFGGGGHDLSVAVDVRPVPPHEPSP